MNAICYSISADILTPEIVAVRRFICRSKSACVVVSRRRPISIVSMGVCSLRLMAVRFPLLMIMFI